ncbi:MAG TPA: hypothetical protein VEZ90_05670, partial [Blastocatellia bacterium]|nr:hypothetical protein [Blastocatellia bacterium]
MSCVLFVRRLRGCLGCFSACVLALEQADDAWNGPFRSIALECAQGTLWDHRLAELVLVSSPSGDRRRRMHSGLRVTWWIGFCALAVAGLSYLWTEH